MTGRVLVVDDDDASLLTLAALLEDEGFEVTTATSLSEARSLLGEAPAFHAVIADRGVGDDDGLELVGPARAKNGATGFALHSGDPPESFPGVDAWLVKGVSSLDTIAAIRRLVDAALSRWGAGA